MVEARKLTEGEKRLRIYLVVLGALMFGPNICLYQYYYLSCVAKEEL